MKNPIYDGDYEALKKEAKESYDKIGRVWCPALNEHIVFKNPGFRHLIWKGPIHRPKSQQKQRFALLAYAEKVIKNANAEVSDRLEGNVHFVAFAAEEDGKKIKVVTRRLSKGERHFFSIFEEK